MPIITSRTLAVALLVSFCLLGATEAQEAGIETSKTGAHRPLGPNLFPLYEHYLRTADDTTVRNLLYLYVATDSPSGSWSTLVTPFFYRSHDAPTAEDRLFLFPLLFFSKSSEDEPFTYSLPFWFYRKKGAVASLDVLFPLFRYTQDARDTERPISSTRFGIWKILEFWESRTTPESTDYTLLNFGNWKDATQGGVAAFHHSWFQEGDTHAGKTYLFPFYWHGNSFDASYRWIVPFYGYSESPGQSDFFLAPLLSRFGGGTDGSRRIDFLFPLFHYAKSPRSLSIASFPLFGYHEDEGSQEWNFLFWPYRTRYDKDSGKRTFSLFFPLSNFNVEPDGSRGTRWAFPYLETFNDKRLWRFVAPLYYEYQALSDGETDSFFRLGLPLYMSWGSPKDFFSMGFPFYYAARDSDRGWQALLPLYLRSYSASSEGTHILPLVSYRSFPSSKQLYILGPLYINERFYDIHENPSGMGNHFLWPLIGVESHKDGHTYRLFPLFSTSRDGDTTSLLLTPLFYIEKSPRGTQRYFMPIHGRHETATLVRDFWAAALYIQTLRRNAEGQPTSTRDDYLWGLASFEKELETGGGHAHILPLYWQTKTRTVDRILGAPFYYSHHIKEADEEHLLSLVLGNVLYSKVVLGPPAGAVPVARGATELNPLAEPAPQSGGTEVVELSRDEGIFWPLVRQYSTAEGESGTWVMPFYFDVKDNLAETTALFPFHYQQDEQTPYQLNFFRYFFLLNQENWKGGYRRTFGQLLFDWKVEEKAGNYRLRLLYPLFEYNWGDDGYEFEIMSLFHLSEKGESSKNWLFPIYWQGSEARTGPDGETFFDDLYFFIFPLFGFHSKPTRTDFYALFPLFHLQKSNDASRWELFPSLYYRDEPNLGAFRLWPLHAHESGVSAGNFWVSRYLFLSKYFAPPDSFSYRLDPSIFRVSSGPDSFGIGGLLELFAYDREGPNSSYRIFPLVFGSSEGTGSTLSFIPFYYGKHFGKQDIDYATPWRFLFLTNSLEGASGERSTGVLWKLFQYTDNPHKSDYHQVDALYGLFLDRKTETSHSFQVNPLFSYFRDEQEDRTDYSFLLSLYQQSTVRGQVKRTLFYFINF